MLIQFFTVNVELTGTKIDVFLVIDVPLMTKAANTDRERIVNILTDSFEDNKSVNYIINQDDKRKLRIKRLMEYSFEVCKMFGEVFITDDKKGCALLIYPEKKKTTLKSILLDIKFITTCLGLGNIKKAMKREAAIHKAHPDGLLYYLWFIGVAQNEQHRGIGSDLMNNIITEAEKLNRTLCLETSTLKNIPWYEKFGLTIYKQFDFGYTLFCMKKD
ncbi:GNAT family N-acetyltransferase [Ferruginibacter paludis]|uniref:GNAT family N-acetyltransferase n=1 Tax=Ferruginibacter paludis TaxID=1310417 RepID=UPI0025B51BFD|nr:GNAT family N-acetyltransferase [Ferruginibacter paludis]MDN3657812.1 GNAT family N-acetyltransferase [Ferruginibacter paludis]